MQDKQCLLVRNLTLHSSLYKISQSQLQYYEIGDFVAKLTYVTIWTYILLFTTIQKGKIY